MQFGSNNDMDDLPMFEVTFRGVRGSLPICSPNFMEFGGNTSCVEVWCGEHLIILDAGTGIRRASERLLERKINNAYILFSHVHWDHVQGFPFFPAAFNKDMTLHIKAGGLQKYGGIEKVLEAEMQAPYFPIPISALVSKKEFTDFKPGDNFTLNSDIAVRTIALNHPNGATAYRIDYAKRSLCYVTDTEHKIGEPDKKILSLIEGSDLVIYDSTYTDEEYKTHVGWGHSTWQEGIRLCSQAGVKKLALFHHDTSHEDEAMRAIEADAKKEWQAAFVAREGKTIKLD